MNLIENFMRTPVKSVSPDLPIREAAKAMLSEGLSAILIKNPKEYVGIITNSDLADMAIAMDIDPAATPVEKIMKSPIIAIDRSQHIVDGARIMREDGIRHLAVTDNGEVIGMLCIADVLAYQLSVVSGD